MKTCQIILQEKFWEVSVQTSARGRDDLFLLWSSLAFGRKDNCGRYKTQKYKHCSSYLKIIKVKRLLLASTLPAIQALYESYFTERHSARKNGNGDATTYSFIVCDFFIYMI